MLIAPTLLQWRSTGAATHLGLRGFVAAQAAVKGGILELCSEELVKQLDSNSHDMLVLDVRSPEELAAGTIKGSFNLPTPFFKQSDMGPLDRAIHDRIKHAKEVVVHCLLCSPGKRGPTAAAALQQRLSALAISPAPRVHVLQGGIDAFMQKYGSRTDLVTLPEGGWKLQAH